MEETILLCTLFSRSCFCFFLFFGGSGEKEMLRYPRYASLRVLGRGRKWVYRWKRSLP